MTARLTTDFWISAYRRRLQLFEIPAFVTNKGDAVAGAILIKLNTLDGMAKLFHRAFDENFNRQWTLFLEGTEIEINETIIEQIKFDSDLWVLEVEDRNGRHLLDDKSLNV
ncbi:DUF1491 family protein [Amylibacter sp.]|jgi:hypothetical protein|nr:DUF1491 family protein [Amylibacter sp.]MDB4188251.1 DUF1491 family protein [bacterium]MDB9739829.1 DUF1491 family protein [Amylibacter sp.]MDB9806483.1 DUF1491 family protein [Amylibacter sp.]MDB9960173.1 DUF1491 family protein [Amylibacter sp.]